MTNSPATIRRSKVTLRDIATRAGCSTATVSTVLNNARGNTRLSPDTQKRILEIARRMNYRPNHAAQSLASRRSRTLGLYVAPAPWSSFGNPHYEGLLLRGIEKACREKKYRLLVVNLQGDESPDACLQEVRQQRVDGMILIQSGAMGDYTRRLLDILPHAALIDAVCPGTQAISVMFDNTAAMDLAVEHLVSLGHRRIAFIGSCIVPPLTDSVQRREGFLRAMKSRALEVPPAWVFDAASSGVEFDVTEEYCQLEGDRAARMLFSHPDPSKRPTALIAYNDIVAAGALRRLQEKGLSVPGDVSLVGVDDSDLARILRPTITSVRQPLEEMGFQAAGRLIERIEPAEKTSPEAPLTDNVISFPPTISIHQSTAPPKDDVAG
ncbi:MAG: LacI family DNA-binding transcriptional regulator [Phycisphaerae bacterium]|nr:LacI family DNA-binding transcriptional regulator [Phycisphaerae bacterium]